jgi:hypothetical protein
LEGVIMSAKGSPVTNPPPPSAPSSGAAEFPLQPELNTYRRELSQLLQAGQAGRYVLIKGNQVVGLWDDQAGALEAGTERFGLEPFAVKQVDPRDVERLARLEAGGAV